MEAIILAGGLGTRLGLDDPKPMAPIGDKPFLEYLFLFLKKQGISHVVLAVGYKQEQIRDYFGDEFNHLKISYSIEQEPLGTGGAIQEALKRLSTPDVFILNGDSFFDIDLNRMLQAHQSFKSDILFSLKLMGDTGRYGTVQTDGNRIIAFGEKKGVHSGLINTGIYLAKSSLFNQFKLPKKFSFEIDFLQKQLANLNACALTMDGYFIDIGVPADYKRAQEELPRQIQLS